MSIFSGITDQAVTETAVEVTDARCPQRIIPTFAILLQKSRPVHGFVKLHGMGTSREECKRKCCERSDCQISFLDNQLCYGLVCAGGPACRAQSFPRQQTYLQLAIIERNRGMGRQILANPLAMLTMLWCGHRRCNITRKMDVAI